MTTTDSDEEPYDDSVRNPGKFLDTRCLVCNGTWGATFGYPGRCGSREDAHQFVPDFTNGMPTLDELNRTYPKGYHWVEERQAWEFFLKNAKESAVCSDFD